ncbi:hypothetical protein CL1_0753 [Thermococcus cleftensis]|uniref:DUF1102 domain-containing protein n=1 Tax=Thermococcus cleftensis (strain DSM 27260 / KACC 17922 / CL1) TaxID=163003 RepID=I3ZTC4_THECF|nr:MULTISPECIES: DUF1102 domain-containing protein [Thermococcus]AFL94958.1 hypothetical protein CL1_0753 [Thermococcus cleftensis]NJE03759.1 DUF1102 domain-containing protein [Thermococcus sp. MV11]
MGTKTEFIAGIGIMIILLIGAGGLHSSDPIAVAYATPDGGEFSIDSPVPPYSYSDGGVLVVDISPDNPFYSEGGTGLSINSTYVFDDVFIVENNQSETGYEVICVRISSDFIGIGFFTGPFNGSWYDVVEVSLRADEGTGIGMRVNTTGLELGDYWGEITIEAWGGDCR